MFKEYDQYDAIGLAELIGSGQVSAKECLEAGLTAMAAVNPKLNAVICDLSHRALSTIADGVPSGPFTGVPFLLKDLLASYAGEPLACGSRCLRDFRPQFDSEMVRRMKAAGLVIFGKTNTPEFGLTPYTEPELFGPSRNPWDPDRTPGGSSGGSAAAVASGIAPMASGGDGGGSIRIPAACCGVFGLKPARGRTPSGPAKSELWQGFAIEHALTRSVRDSAALLDALAGPDPGAPFEARPAPCSFLEAAGRDPGPLKIAFTTEPMLGTTMAPECVESVHATAKLLEGLGHHVEEAAPKVDQEVFCRSFFRILCGEVRADIEEAARTVGRKPRLADFEATTWVLGLLGQRFSAADMAAAKRALGLIARAIGPFFERYDVLLTPTLSGPAAPVGSLKLPAAEQFAVSLLARFNAARLLELSGGADRSATQAFEFTPFTPVFNVTGQPAMSVPLAWTDDNLPLGLHFVGRPSDEVTLYSLAGQLERAQPWAHRRPPIHG